MSSDIHGMRMSIREFTKLFSDCPRLQDVRRLDMNLAFVLSAFDVADQRKNANFRSLSFVDFLEAIARLTVRHHNATRGRSGVRLTLVSFCEHLRRMLEEHLLPLMVAAGAAGRAAAWRRRWSAPEAAPPALPAQAGATSEPAGPGVLSLSWAMQPATNLLAAANLLCILRTRRSSYYVYDRPGPI